MPQLTAETKQLLLSPELVAAIEKYLDTDWGEGASIGALNAVAFIGELVAATYAIEHINARAAGKEQ